MIFQPILYLYESFLLKTKFRQFKQIPLLGENYQQYYKIRFYIRLILLFTTSIFFALNFDLFLILAIPFFIMVSIFFLRYLVRFYQALNYALFGLKNRSE